MSMPVRIDPDLYVRAAIDNPDLPVEIIIDLLSAKSEPVKDKRPFIRREI